MSYYKAKDERINENLNKHEQSTVIKSDMLFFKIEELMSSLVIN